MLVDFCHWSLQPTVTCDKPSCDGYEAQNLVSKDSSLHRKGFLAANFIKPPVNITFQFPCKISIHRVLINPVVGAQKSTTVEIYTSCKRIASSWLFQEDSVHVGTRGKLTFDSPLFMNVGKISLENPTKICFTYPRFTASVPYSCERMHVDGFVMAELRNTRYQYLTAVSQLTVRITRTSASCVPALKSVEILGQPAVSNGRDILQKVYQIFNDSVNPVPIKQEVSKQEEADECKIEMDSGLQIPDEFIDPITCEIMALPVLLPCGKNLDQSTLEKHISAESSWGRCPNDPFTGVAFSAESHPIPNDSLKVRIDTFLFQNSSKEKLKLVPRTVGRNVNSYVNQTYNKNVQPSVSSLTQRNSKRKIDVNQESVIVPERKKTKTNNAHVLKMDPVIKSEPEDYQTPQSSTSQGKGGNSSHRNHKPVSCLSHEHQLDNSLSQALSLLNSLPSFTRKQKTEVQTQTKCVNCSSGTDSLTVMYRLECSHFICRPCVLNPGSSDQTIQCRQCMRTSHLSDVTRVHVV